MRRILFTTLMFSILISACNAAAQVLPTAIVIVVTPTPLPPIPVIIVITATPSTNAVVPLPTLITLATNPPQQQTTQVVPPTAQSPMPTATTASQPTAIPTVKPTNTPIVSSPIPTPYNNNFPAVFGPHQNGFFIYLSDRKEIWAFMGQGTAPILTPVPVPSATPTPIPNGPWLKFADPFKPGVDLDSDPSIAAPPGLLQPKGGFGKIWRTNTTVKTSLGWALDWERGYVVNITDYYTRGTGTQLILQHIITVPDGTIYFVDESKGTWEIRR